jgi:hypothetical protein
MMDKLGKERYKRWQIYLEKPFKLDDYGIIKELVNIGEQFIEENDDSINEIVRLFKKDEQQF